MWLVGGICFDSPSHKHDQITPLIHSWADGQWSLSPFDIRHRILTERWNSRQQQLRTRVTRAFVHRRSRLPSVSYSPTTTAKCQLVCVALESRRRQTTKWFPMSPENIAPRRDTECRPAMHCQFGFGGVGSMGDNIRKKATSDTLPKPGKVNSGTIFIFLLLHFYLLMFTYR